MRNKFFAAFAVAAGITACSGKDSPPASTKDSAVATASSGFALTAAQKARIHIITVANTLFQPSVDVTGTVAFNGDRSTQVLSPV